MPAWVIVDDFDSGIVYEGPWMWSMVLTDDVSQEVAFNNTGHMLLSNATGNQAGNLTYSFNGSQVAVFGNSTIFNVSSIVGSDGDESDPMWACYVDGTLIPSNSPYGAFPWTSYCESDSLSFGTHLLEVQVLTTSAYGFSMDFIRYLPLDEIITDGLLGNEGATAWLNSTDEQLGYSSEWEPLATGMMTFADTLAADGPPSFFMDFNGSSLTWYSLSKDIIFTQSSNPSSLVIDIDSVIAGVYQVDGGEFIEYSLNLSAPSQILDSTLNPYSTILLRTPEYVVGQHNLSVWYQGAGSGQWPLTLDYITIENGFSSTPTSSAGSSESSSAPTSMHKSKGAVIGGAVGGVFGGILLIIFVLFLMRQRSVAQRKKRSSNITRWANTDIKLRPVSREVTAGAEDPNGPQKYPFTFEGQNQGRR